MFRALPTKLGNPLNWSLTDKCLLIALAVLPFAAWHVAILYGAVRHPETVPYLDREFIAQSAPLIAGGWLGGWLLIATVGLVLRRRSPESRALMIATIQLYCIGGGLLSYTVGPFTSNYVGAVGLSGFVVGVVLLERRAVFIGIVTFLSVLAASSIAERLGVIPYAPMMAASPVENRHLSGSWLRGFGQLTIMVEVFGIALAFMIVNKWRDREEKLAITSAQLARANEIISRFVPAQVADQIRAANYGAVDRTDRRRLTICFSDIKDFSATADRLEPEELSEVLNEYFDEMLSIAERYGATVDKFIGDAIMVFFGAPIGPHEPDHAVGAVRMALEMQRRTKILQERWRARGVEGPFEIRIGVNTGIANVGAFGARGRMDYTAIGRQVNLAARLQVNCEPGQVLISHATWALVQDQVTCVPQGEIRVKGFHAPVRVYVAADEDERVPEFAPEAATG